MFHSCFVAVLLGALLWMGNPTQKSTGQAAALSKLDQLLKEEESITRKKEARLDSLRTRLGQIPTDRERYPIVKQLYIEYARYNLDSALYYAHLKEDLARKLGDQALLNDALNDRADRYIISGMYRYAEDVLDSMVIDENASTQALVSYHRSLISLHHGLKLTNKDPLYNERLDKKEHYYRNLIFNAADSTVLYLYTYTAENLIDEGRPEEARKVLEQYLGTGPTNPDELSILNYCIAKTYRAQGDLDQTLTYFAMSAWYDISEGVRSSRSLIKTAQMAMEEGMTARSFSYITRAYDDATQADARICLEEISRFMPEVIASYEKLSSQRYKDVLLILFLVALLLIASIIGLIIFRRFQVKIVRLNRKVKSVNQKLSDSVHLMESTLGQYVTMFTSHINSLEEYRSSIRVVAKSKDIEEITRALRSDDYIDAKRETLLTEFDRAFLAVFPDFVEQLNALLKEDQRVGQNLPTGKLTNELRVFALIRLGVTESADISKFLKKSPSTIYNYRVKLRNASIYSNEEFENRLMAIGKPHE
jgi:phosphoserine phosphatase